HLNGNYLPDTIAEALALLGGLDRAIRRGDAVMIKPNFNASRPLPASTDRAFLAAVIEILLDAGAKVSVGELSGRADWPTAKVVKNLKILPLLKRYGVPFVDFEFDTWVRLAVDGQYWRSFRVPRSIYEAEKRVYLANMRTHSTARFSASLKLSVGWIDLEDRLILHGGPEGDEKDSAASHEAKIAELNLGWQPDLVLIDGRRSIVDRTGRTTGQTGSQYVYPNVVMASGDMVAVDAEAVRILKQIPAPNNIGVPLREMGQLAVAEAHRLGSIDALVLEAPANAKTTQD
ncbi:MAG: DUF362 domain-containing protein, partial [Acidobacteria bacterium]|nr:DUF362 domain-containing protein [Acidobacteriota bacterium]